jgi:hypothetical protein
MDDIVEPTALYQIEICPPVSAGWFCVLRSESIRLGSAQSGIRGSNRAACLRQNLLEYQLPSTPFSISRTCCNGAQVSPFHC